MTEIDEEIARLWAQANGVNPATAREIRARATDQHLERAYYRDPADLAIGRITREEKKANGKRKSKRTTR